MLCPARLWSPSEAAVAKNKPPILSGGSLGGLLLSGRVRPPSDAKYILFLGGLSVIFGANSSKGDKCPQSTIIFDNQLAFG